MRIGMRSAWSLAGVLTLACGVLAQPATTPATPASQPPAAPDTTKPEAPKPEAPKAPETKPAQPAKESFVYVSLKTNKGDIVLELNREKAPLSVENFLKYADKGFYDGTIFHRVIANFMIQGGGFLPDLSQKKTEAPIKNEWKNGLKNERGTVAMARTAVADSATSQFFINVENNAFLDQPRDGAAYAVFGRVVSGMETVDAIRKVPTGIKRGMSDVPNDTVTIEKVRRLTDSEVEAVKQGK